MFRDFAERKFDDYIALLEFPAGRISFSQIGNSSLPPFIISFIEYYVPNHNIPLNKVDFEEILKKAIIFNINYVIKPKNTILKFLFGDVETRPVNFIFHRLEYFQFYGYYTSQISDFININSLDVVSYGQIDHLINEVNNKLYEEITGQSKDSQRMNLVKLLYYFFHDLGENNPINIKIPKKILSVYFQDKGFIEIKKRIDGFFSNDIFIQEAITLMNPETQKAPKRTADTDVSEEKVNRMISEAKSMLISKDASNQEVEKVLPLKEKFPLEIPEINIRLIRENESKLPEIEKRKLIIDEEIYSDDLMFVTQFKDLVPPVQLTEEEKHHKLIEDLFCEAAYRKKILRTLFSKDENLFFENVKSVLNEKNWLDASNVIEDIFNKQKVDYFSEEAVKFVDIFHSHFVKDFIKPNNSKAS
jgi:hypothetical protein